MWGIVKRIDVEGTKKRKAEAEVDGQFKCGLEGEGTFGGGTQNRAMCGGNWSETSSPEEEVVWDVYQPVRMVTCRTGTLAGSWAALSQSTQSCERKSTG